MVLAGHGVGQGSIHMMAQEVRERFQGRSWGAAKKKVPYFTTSSRILVVIRAPGKMLIGFLVSDEGYSLRESHANM